MRLVVASVVLLMCTCQATAVAEVTAQSNIRVTNRPLSELVGRPVGTDAVQLGRPPDCGILNPGNSTSRARPVVCGVVPSAPDWTVNEAPTLTHQEQLQAAKRGFAALDRNHDGMISRQEWSASERRATALAPEHGRVQLKCGLEQEFKLLDGNHDGKITFAEFTADNFGKDRPPIRPCY